MLLSPSIKVYLLLSVFIPFPITAIATLAPHAFSQRAKPGGGDCQAKPPINGPQASAVQPGYSWPTGDHEYMMIHVWILYIYIYVYINTCNYIYMPVMHIMCGVSYSYLQWFWPYSMRERRRCLLLRIHHNHRRDRSCEFHEYYYHGHHDSHANVDVQ